MEIENNNNFESEQPQPEPQPEKGRVKKTHNPNYFSEYYQNHKNTTFKVYVDRAKERVYTCDLCKISTAAHHTLRHSRTARHIRKLNENQNQQQLALLNQE